MSWYYIAALLVDYTVTLSELSNLLGEHFVFQPTIFNEIL